jgi:hypothetical protein
MAYVAGDALGRRLGSRAIAHSGVALLLLGLALFYVVWLVPTVTMGAGLLSSVLRVFAVAITWVATTVGFGAAILTRGGTREVAVGAPAVAPPEDEYAWQTPTPVTGVTAARRPTPVPPPSRDYR